MVRDRLLQRKVLSSAQTPRPQNWFNVPLGRSGVVLSNIANTHDGRIGVRVYISHKVVDIVLPELEAKRKQIEDEIGHELEWNPNPDVRDKVIVLQKQVNLEDREQWSDYVEWMVDQMTSFRKAFMPRLKNINMKPSSQTTG